MNILWSVIHTAFKGNILNGAIRLIITPILLLNHFPAIHDNCHLLFPLVMYFSCYLYANNVNPDQTSVCLHGKVFWSAFEYKQGPQVRASPASLRCGP